MKVGFAVEKLTCATRGFAVWVLVALITCAVPPIRHEVEVEQSRDVRLKFVSLLLDPPKSAAAT